MVRSHVDTYGSGTGSSADLVRGKQLSSGIHYGDGKKTDWKSEIHWTLIGHQGESDEYRFTWVFNPVGGTSASKEATVVYDGEKPMIVFQNDSETVSIEPGSIPLPQNSQQAPKSDAENDLIAALETFPGGIWNKPLTGYARSIRKAHVVLIDLTSLDNDQWLDPIKFGLATDAPGETVAMKASRGDLYIPEVDVVTPVRGTKFAPLRLAKVHEDLPPPNQASWREAVAGMTLQDIAQQIIDYDSTHKDKAVHLQHGARYGALRPDGQLVLVRAFGPTELSMQFIPVGAIKLHSATTEPGAIVASKFSD